MSGMENRVAVANWLQHNVSARDRRALRLACELIGDPTAEHLQAVEAGRQERSKDARRACRERRERRRRREEAAAQQQEGQHVE